MGVDGILDVRNNPAPTVHECRDGLAAELGPGAWVDVSQCELDLENAMMVLGEHDDDAVFIALRDPDSGEQAGVLRFDDPAAVEAINAIERDPGPEPSEATTKAASVLFATPRTGMTARVVSGEKELLVRGLRGFGEDEPVIEFGETPHPTRSWVLTILGAIGLAASGWGLQRAKRAKAREEAQIAQWHATTHAHHNPYLR